MCADYLPGMGVSLKTLTPLLFLSSCGPWGRDGVLDRFQQVNDSLTVRTARTHGSMSELPPIPFEDMGCTEFQQRSDALHAAVEGVEQAMAPLFVDLSGVAQDDRQAAVASFDEDEDGAALFDAITAAIAVALDAAPDDSTRSLIDHWHKINFPYPDVASWRTKTFVNTDRSTAVGSLADLRRKWHELRSACDQSMLKACIEKAR